MHDAFLVCSLERFAYVLRNTQSLVDGNRPMLEAAGKGIAFHEFQNQKARTAGFLQVIDGRNVRMIKRSEHLRLPLKTIHAIRIAGKLIRKDLDCNFTLEL